MILFVVIYKYKGRWSLCACFEYCQRGKMNDCYADLENNKSNELVYMSKFSACLTKSIMLKCPTYSRIHELS